MKSTKLGTMIKAENTDQTMQIMQCKAKNGREQKTKQSTKQCTNVLQAKQTKQNAR